MYLIVFDVDGTLVDSQDTIMHGLQVGFEAAGLPLPDRQTALSIVGLSLHEAFQTLLAPEFHDKIPLMTETYRQAKVSRRQAGLDRDPLYPGARDAIDRLHGREEVLLGIATGKALRGVKHLLDCHDLHGRFLTIQTADTSPSKPAPDMILRAMAETGVEPERTLMIGDTGFDMQMAKSAGVRALGVSWGYHDPVRLAAGGAEKIIDTYAELDQAVAEMLNFDRETI
ncbi:HAD-IA family hydrolase [Roseibium sp. M-1]